MRGMNWDSESSLWKALSIKNYSSKQAVNNQTNENIYITVQSLQVLQLQFDCDYHDVEHEKKNRKRRDEKRKENRREIPIFDDTANSMTIDGQSDDVLGTVEPPVRV